MVEVGLIGDWISPKLSNPDVFAMIAVFESFDLSDAFLSAPGDGDVEWSGGETAEVDLVSLFRERSKSKDARSLGDLGEVGSVAPCGLERSEEDVDGRASSSCLGR